ncbi:MAG: prepilin peptidase [Clostridia bacterium]|nr:prepilin peptidase [Clostridia bacterium]
MIETFLLIILFIVGIYFGSFFTLATYRLPKKENIIYKHSYCPNCNHKLGILDLVPIFSYLFLGGKCRYCKNPIGIRYFLFEILTGIVFVLLGISLKIDIYNIEIIKIIYLGLVILYIASLFIIAGINKEQDKIQKSVLYFGIGICVVYIIYSCTLNLENVYKYVIYLCMMLILILLDTLSFKKNLKYNETIQICILILYMLIITGEYITIFTLLFTILMMGIENIMMHIKKRKSQKVRTKKTKRPIAFYLCVANIILLIGSNFLINYMVK